jgi:hypothetical protein
MTLPRRSVWCLALVLLATPGAVRAGTLNLFVSSSFSSPPAVLEYNGTTGAFVTSFASGNGLRIPQGLAFGPNGDLFVSNSDTSSVLEYNGTTGALVGTFASGGGLVSPTYLIFAVPEPSSLALLAGDCPLAGWPPPAAGAGPAPDRGRIGPGTHRDTPTDRSGAGEAPSKDSHPGATTRTRPPEGR